MFRERSRLHPAIEVRASPIHGQGLFTTEDLPTGTTVIELGGVVLGDDELHALIPPYSSVGLGQGRHLLIQVDDPVRYGNHSCEPNLWVDDALRESTRRSVAAGEELTIDYATQTTQLNWSMLCVCDASTCRSLITGRDWRQEVLQRRYGDHWVPALRHRITRDRPNEW